MEGEESEKQEGKGRGGANLKHTREITRYSVVISPHAQELWLGTPNKVLVMVCVLLLTAAAHVQEPAPTSSKRNHFYRLSFLFLLQFRLPHQTPQPKDAYGPSWWFSFNQALI